MSHKDQSGFIMVVEVIIIVLVLAALGYVGWSLYTNYYSKQNSVTNSTSQKPTSGETATAQPTYLVIKEWGVEIPLSDTIKDAYYVVSKGSSYGPGGLPSTIWLGLASYSSASCNPANNDAGERGAIGAILRVLPTETDPVKRQLLTQEYPNGATIGGWYYAYQSWATNNPCASESTLQPIDSAFAAAAKGTVTATTTAQPTYLDIKELGIKLPLSDSIKDLTYTYGNQDGINFLHFTTSSIKVADPTCNEAKDPPGTYTVYTAPQPDTGYELPGTLEAHVNGYYIYYSHVQYACGFGDSNNTASMVSSAIAPLLTAVHDAQAQ